MTVEELATRLHKAADSLPAWRYMELDCWCRRIATVDGTFDGQLADDWKEDWGFTPPYCEEVAKGILYGNTLY